MTWVKLDDQFPDHPKVIAAGPAAAWLYVSALCFCSRYLTDGFVPDHMLEHLTQLPKVRTLAARLVELGLWQPAGGGWWVHDYGKHQRTKAQIEREREAASRRQSRRRHGVTAPEVTRPETEAETETDLSIPTPYNEERRPQLVDKQERSETRAQQTVRRLQAKAVTG